MKTIKYKPNNYNIKKYLNICFNVSLLITVILFLLVDTKDSTEKVLIKSEKTIAFNEGWNLDNGKYPNTIITLPSSIKNYNREGVIMSKILPVQIDPDTVLSIKLSFYNIQAFINGKEIYRNTLGSDTHFDNLNGNIYNTIPISQDYAGEKITLLITCPYRTNIFRIPEIKLGLRGSNFLNILKDNIIEIIFCIITFILGFLFIGVSFLDKVRKENLNWKTYSYLGLFMIMASLWICTDTGVIQFFVDNDLSVRILSFLIYSLMPIPFLLFTSEVCPFGRKLFYLSEFLFLVNFYIVTSLYQFRILNFIHTIYSTHILILTSITIFFYCLLKEKKSNNDKDIRILLLGIIMLCIFIILALLEFYVNHGNNSSSFFCIGLIIFEFFITLYTIRRSFALLRENIESKTYKKLAYLDMMTQCGNRIAFNEDCNKLKLNFTNYSSLAILVFDLNNLKETNDSHGHIIGDDLIIGMGSCIHKTFSLIGKCYRIGGDEFVVLMTNHSDKEINDYLTKLNNYKNYFNKKHNYQLSYAAGYARMEQDQFKDDFIEQLFNEADQKMYQNKFQSKI